MLKKSIVIIPALVVLYAAGGAVATQVPKMSTQELAESSVAGSSPIDCVNSLSAG